MIKPPSLLLASAYVFFDLRTVFTPRRITVFCGKLYILFTAGYEPPSLSTKNMYITNIFIILQHRESASLKTFQLHSVPWKEKSASKNSRAFQYIVCLQRGLYFDFKRKNAWAAPRSTDLALRLLSSCPLSCMLLLRFLLWRCKDQATAARVFHGFFVWAEELNPLLERILALIVDCGSFSDLAGT